VKTTFIAIVALALAGCASTAMKGYVGKPIEEAFMTQGAPENVFDLPDGRRAFQFRWGGGALPVAGQSRSVITAYGNSATVVTTGTPAMIYESAGCLVTLIGAKQGESYVITEYRIPKTLVC
jgi:hypothetical protein